MKTAIYAYNSIPTSSTLFLADTVFAWLFVAFSKIEMEAQKENENAELFVSFSEGRASTAREVKINIAFPKNDGWVSHETVRNALNGIERRGVQVLMENCYKEGYSYRFVTLHAVLMHDEKGGKAK